VWSRGEGPTRGWEWGFWLKTSGEGGKKNQPVEPRTDVDHQSEKKKKKKDHRPKKNIISLRRGKKRDHGAPS